MEYMELTIRIPLPLAAEAEQFDLLREERIAALIEREILREEAWLELSKMAEIVREGAADTYGTLSDDEVMFLVNEEIKIMRAEDRAKEALPKPASS
jgi:hypothetical protein